MNEREWVRVQKLADKLGLDATDVIRMLVKMTLDEMDRVEERKHR